MYLSNDTIQKKTYFCCKEFANYVPMFTLSDPDIITLGTLASIIVSPTLAAGLLFMNTVLLPIWTIPPTWGFKPSTRGQVWKSDKQSHAGLPLIRTFKLPGPGKRGEPWLVLSDNLAANGISNLYCHYKDLNEMILENFFNTF